MCPITVVLATTKPMTAMSTPLGSSFRSLPAGGTLVLGERLKRVSETLDADGRETV
jgi:hypothetical protein